MKQKLQAAAKEAMKARDKVRLEAIRGVITAIQYEEIEKKQEPLPEQSCLTILQREIKKRKEELEFAAQAKRDDLLEKLRQEIASIEAFLPKQLSSSEIEKFLVDLKSSNPDFKMGIAMKELKDQFPGQYDSKIASEVAKRIFGC